MSGRPLDWYFDYLSPFAYLQFRRFRAELPQAEFRYRPILFAALLNHWGSKGPAEMPSKRTFTYRHVVWLGTRLGYPIRMPPAHPFAPLKPLRLTLALDCAPQAIETIFRFVWEDGRDPESEFDSLAARLGVNDAAQLIARQDVKDRLKQNTEQAIAAGVFGVPSTMVDGQLFWGLDSTDMLRDYLSDPGMLSAPEMQRVSTLPLGAVRTA
jgi:2-hydroxychromene-2-carboxylate isomerase